MLLPSGLRRYPGRVRRRWRASASRIRRSRELSCVASCVVGLGTTCRPCARRRRPRRARPTRITGGPRAVSGVAAPSTENHRSFVGGVVRSGAKRTRGNRTSRLDHVAFDRDRTGRHLQIWMESCLPNQPGSEAVHETWAATNWARPCYPAPSIARTRDRSTAAVSESQLPNPYLGSGWEAGRARRRRRDTNDGHSTDDGVLRHLLLRRAEG